MIGTGYILTFQNIGKGSIVRKYWTKAKLETSWADSKLRISMSDVKMLFKSPTLFSLVDHNTLLSLGLAPFPVSSSPWQGFYCSGISNTLGSPRQYKIQLHSFSQQPLYYAPIQGHP